MRPEPEFLEVEDVLEFHAAMLARHGGKEGIRDMGLLASAMAQPRAMFSGEFLHPDLFGMAAAYAFHIAQNRPFLDGNKRAALMAALVFLDINGEPIDAPTDRLYEAMVAVAERKLDKSGLSNLFRELPQF